MNRNKTKLSFRFLIVMMLFSFLSDSCAPRRGCTDPNAYNYDSSAKEDDGSCANTPGCTDSQASNYDPLADIDDGSCQYPSGCTDNAANNYDPAAVNDDGSCWYYYGQDVGKITVFREDECWETDVNVFFGNQLEGVLTNYYTSLPDCDAEAEAGKIITFVDAYGDYDFKATSASGTQWKGKVYIPRNACVDVRLKCGGYIDGTALVKDNTVGEITVWTKLNFGSDINVTINNINAGMIRTSYDSIPSCGSSGCVTKCNLLPGTYSINASVGAALWENYTIQVFGGECSKFELK